MTPLALLLSVSLALPAQVPAAPGPAAPKASRRGAEYHAPATTTPAARIIQEIKTHQEAVANLETLCDTIGPRLTGSERLLKAHTWTEAKLKGYGLTVLPREAYEFGPNWTRGAEKARLLTHSGASLAVAQMAWTPATKGPISGEVVAIDFANPEAALPFIGTFKSKIVAMAPMNPADLRGGSEAHRAAGQKLTEALGKEGIAALLMTSDKKDGLLNMTGSPKPRPWFRLPKVPTGFLSAESMGMLTRLTAHPQKVIVELELGGVTGAAPVQAYNTVAELKGSEQPEEIVLLGAHLDSWDLGTGATDNGTGVVAVMEALRAIQALGLKPKRTLRVVLFSGEEQGLLGSTAYAKAHAAELAKYQAVLIHDLGSGKVKGFALQNREDLRPYMARAIAPLQELEVKELPLESSRDSDHAPFVGKGVPAFFCIQEAMDYFSATHHTHADTFEHVQPEQLLQGAAAMAVTAWELANMAERLPHAAPEAERSR